MIEIKFVENSLIDLPIIISILSPLAVGLLTFLLAKRRYTYEKLLDKKLVVLTEIYRMVIPLEVELNKYILVKGHGLPESKREEIKNAYDRFFELQNYFWENEIILDEDSAQEIQSIINLSNEILANLNSSIVSQEVGANKDSYEQWNKSYLLWKDKLPEAKRHLRIDFKETIEK
ncbi:MAG: hypothetical protein WC791_01840 [Candidatus Paceibacterota bacterium]|jgi:hypothetical protein